MSSTSDITTTSPETDWKYVSEGGATIVFSYIGPPDPVFDGMVLRLRKVPNVPVGVRDDTDSSDTDEEDEEEEEDPTISFQRQCMSRLIPSVHLPRLQSVIVRADPVRSVSIDDQTGVYVQSQSQSQRTTPREFHGPPHIHSNRWLRTMAKAHDSERPEGRKKSGGLDVHKQKGVLATDLVGGKGISVEIKPKWSFLPNPTYLSESTRPIKSQTCRFCMHSFLRSQTSSDDAQAQAHPHAQGEVALGYCPLDLFSNDESRVRKALYALWDAWVESGGKVNNLKVFVDGKILRPDQQRLLLAKDDAETPEEDDIRETFTKGLIPLLTRTSAFQTLNRLQRTLDMLDVEGLGQAWKIYHQHRLGVTSELPELGFGMEEPTIDEWMAFIDRYLEQLKTKPAEVDGREYAFLPGPLPPREGEGEGKLSSYTEQELRSYLLAYLLSATFKDCSVIIRIPLLGGGDEVGKVEDTPPDPKRVTIIDLDPKSMTRLRRWELLDAQIVEGYREVDAGARKVCVDACA
ncbi:hypothetical protein E1B28_013593 [Marasmius oreades]|uniref:Inositol-pentakisphosphate 2-kinase n=1 Tax=Marasmius oreades TaxID=181124 RepID=A0A9P7RQ57_9AGAR|nr:uncharacterized protein E1B28_013593 [Marasmius oreades]KAG7087645.1 hypothetical protein E1B28_013593 [Marasmius oreades]